MPFRWGHLNSVWKLAELIALPPQRLGMKMNTENEIRHAGEPGGWKLPVADLLFAAVIVAIAAGWILGAALLTW
jgi:hypothetical protein